MGLSPPSISTIWVCLNGRFISPFFGHWRIMINQMDGWMEHDGTMSEDFKSAQKNLGFVLFFLQPVDGFTMLFYHVTPCVSVDKRPENSGEVITFWSDDPKRMWLRVEKNCFFQPQTKKGRIFTMCNIINSHFWSQGARVWCWLNTYDGQFKFHSFRSLGRQYL